MPLPDADAVRIPKRKLTEYLLNPEHEKAGGKADYFIRQGFRREAWELFAEHLREHAARCEVVETDKDEYGTSFSIEGPLRLPGGSYTKLDIRSIWMIPQAGREPRFITAYPISS